ncbi:MAG: hypothetical protein M3P26_07335 [Gemmatimonadota bacterium]|nr:hypothetical protein [Gemmatimonadota bacterium]
MHSAEEDVSVARWRKKAIDESVRQIYGAERKLARMERVIRSTGSPGFLLPPADYRRVHRVAVALGSSGEVMFAQGDFGKGFVHVLDDRSLGTVMGELDTVSDFVSYLSSKEALVTSGEMSIVSAGEEELLAIYLHAGRKFPTGADVLMVEPGAWGELISKAEWQRRKEADQSSYVWDKLIEGVARDVLGPGLESGEPDQAERVTRIMARETRFSRRVIAEAFNEFMRLAAQKRVRARWIPSRSGVVYVFLAAARNEPRELRMKELGLRCFVARSLLPEYAPVVGLATERYVRGQGYSLDTCLIDMPIWTEKDQAIADGIKKELGYFREPLYSRVSHDEYPVAAAEP